jgi:Fe-S oxidoreductase
VAAIRRTGATVVASANPGCAYHLAAGLDGVVVRHPLEVVEEALRGGW